MIPGQVCFKCMASMGRENPAFLYTDLRPTAAWRNTVHTSLPWSVQPALAKLAGFSLALVCTDLLHCWALGVLRDVVGSTLKILVLSKTYYVGSTIRARLQQCFREVRKFAADNRCPLKVKKLNRDTLNWKGRTCPELRTCGSDATVFLRYLNQKLLVDPPPTEKYQGMLACIWKAERFSRVLSKGGVFLTPEENAEACKHGWDFLVVYVKLAHEAAASGEWYWKLRPKFHHLTHMLLWSMNSFSKRNPGHDCCWMDEDYVKHLMQVVRKLHPLTASRNVLRRSLVTTKQTMLDYIDARAN